MLHSLKVHIGSCSRAPQCLGTILLKRELVSVAKPSARWRGFHAWRIHTHALQASGQSRRFLATSPPAAPTAPLPTVEQFPESICHVESTTGEIEVHKDEFLVYYDMMFPLWVKGLYLKPIAWLLSRDTQGIASRLKAVSVPEGLSVKMVDVFPRVKDGGTFVKFRLTGSATDPASEANATATAERHKRIIQRLSQTLYNSNERPWFNPFRRMRVFEVKGVPWLEDLKPSQTRVLKTTFEGPMPSREQIYEYFRRYGVIEDLVPDASTYTIFYKYTADAATARNCLNRYTKDGSTVHILFGTLPHRNMIRSFIAEHTRIFIPIFIALLAALAVLVFEPIRVYFIQKKICGKTLTDEIVIFKWLQQLTQRTWTYLGISDRRLMTGDFDNLWEDRQNCVKTIEQWVSEGVGTFIIVHGPRGSGKTELVMGHALHGRKDVLHVDVNQIMSARDDAQFIKTVSQQIGYSPVFPWMNNIATFIDLAMTGLTGQKSGLAETPENQLKNMLVTASVAIRKTALENKLKVDPQVSDEQYLALHPEEKPVIVLDKFLAKNNSGRDYVNKQIATWAAGLVASNIAHVIFITSDVAYNRVLGESVPTQVFKVVQVGDANSESAMSFVEQQVNWKEHPSEETLSACLDPLGGRMTDLQAFARRLKSGDTPSEALDDMISQASLEILQMFLMKCNSEWSREQAWVLVRAIAESPDGAINTNFLYSNPLLKSESDRNAIAALERYEMVTTTTVGGRIVSVKAGKPLYHAAFQHLVENPSLCAFLDIEVLNSRVAKETQKIEKMESELSELATVPNKWELRSRIDYLAKKVYESQCNIEKFEKDIKDRQKRL